MGIFGRNKQQQQDSVPPQAKEEFVIEVQDANHEHRHTTKPKKKMQEQIDVKESATENTAEGGEEVEIDLAAHRDVIQEMVLQQTPTKDSRRMKVIVALIVLFTVILAFFLAVILTFTGRNDSLGIDSGDEINATVEELEPDYNSNEAAYLMDILGVYTAVNVLADDTVPQGQAFLKLLHDEQAASQRTPTLRVEQRYALQVLYLSTSPDEWTNSAGWNTVEPEECSWNGVETCSSIDEEGVMVVSSVVLESNNLHGTIPTELCILGNLQRLNLAHNFLMGDFHECLCGLENLVTFNAAGNALGSTIPNCVVELANLATLDLANNQMRGTIPAFGVTSLKNINVSNNELTGELDGLFVAASRFDPTFVELHLDNNQFTGTIPDLSEVLSLTHFTVTENQLTGELTFCGGFSELEQLEVDCLEVDCACCTNDC